MPIRNEYGCCISLCGLKEHKYYIKVKYKLRINIQHEHQRCCFSGAKQITVPLKEVNSRERNSHCNCFGWVTQEQIIFIRNFHLMCFLSPWWNASGYKRAPKFVCMQTPKNPIWQWLVGLLAAETTAICFGG